jgi:hypothetical protein
MKYILEFSADERIEALQCATAQEAWGALSDIKQAIRNWRKHGEEGDAPELVRSIENCMPTALEEVW